MLCVLSLLYNTLTVQYFYLEKIAAGPYGYEWDISEGNESTTPHLHLKIRKYKHGRIDPTTRTYDVSNITTSKHRPYQYTLY